MPDPDSFWSRVARGETDACWLWQGGRLQSGYGRYSPHHRTTVRAHRHAYLLTHGSVPPVLRHTCDNPLCVNPNHLIPGSHADNMRDMTDRGRQRKGEAHRNAKLKDRDVQVMRVLRSIGCDLSEIGERYGVTPQTVWRVEKRISYRYVPDLDLSQEVLR